MIIDQKGRLLGKINVIDLLILLALLAVIVFGATKMVSKKSAATTNNSTITMQFYAEEVPDYVANKVKIGDVVKEDGKSVDLGTVKSVEVSPSQSYGTNDQGQAVLTSKEKMNSILITTEVQGKMTPNGCEVNASLYSPGHTMTLRAGIAKISLRVFDVKAKG